MYSELKGISFEYTPDLPKVPKLSFIPVASETPHLFTVEDKVVEEYHQRLQAITELKEAREIRQIQRLERRKLREIRRAPGYSSSKTLEPTQSAMSVPVTNAAKTFDLGEFEANYSADPWEMNSMENELNVLQDVLSSSSNLTSNSTSPIKPLNAISSSVLTSTKKFTQMGFSQQDVEIIIGRFGDKSDPEVCFLSNM
jgi:hypothetical protein